MEPTKVNVSRLPLRYELVGDKIVAVRRGAPERRGGKPPRELEEVGVDHF